MVSFTYQGGVLVSDFQMTLDVRFIHTIVYFVLIPYS